jgi:heptaprenyl diphosphate synthase
MGVSLNAIGSSSFVIAEEDLAAEPLGRTAEVPHPPGALVMADPHRVVANFAGVQRLTSDLEACAEGVTRAAAIDAPIIGGLTREFLTGGKRLRPLLVLATAYSGPADRDRAIRSTVVVELLHLASLVHDDVMDEAAQRHGDASTNVRVGNVRAVLAGDYLLARALATACELGQAEGMLAAETFTGLCDGQARESEALFDTGRTEGDYYAAIKGKTGALFAASCRLGAMAAGLGERATTALTEYGLHLGMAYQLIDDLLDFTSPSSALGKPAGHDITAGVFTLPVLHALREDPRLAELLHRAGSEAASGTPAGGEAARRAADVVRESGGLAVTRRAAENRTEQAIAALSRASDDIGTAALAMLTELVAALADRRN